MNYFKQTKNNYESDLGVYVYDRDGLKETEEYIMKRYFVAPGKILDIGCGTGRTSIAFKDFGLDVAAIDYSEKMIVRAKEKYVGSGVSFTVMDASNLAYDNAEFDYVFFSFNGLDYLYPETNRRKALEEVNRVLKPRGIFAFSSHNSHFLPNNLCRLWITLRSFLRGKVHPYRLDFQSFGALLTHYISPRRQIADLKACGFDLCEIINQSGPYPSYVARKIK